MNLICYTPWIKSSHRIDFVVLLSFDNISNNFRLLLIVVVLDFDLLVTRVLNLNFCLFSSLLLILLQLLPLLFFPSLPRLLFFPLLSLDLEFVLLLFLHELIPVFVIIMGSLDSIDLVILFIEGDHNFKDVPFLKLSWRRILSQVFQSPLSHLHTFFQTNVNV